MILHCSKRLAAKLGGVSPIPLEDANPMGSWHGHVFTMDRRQCVMLCHDETRFVLFMAGWRKAQFDELGSKWFPQLFTAALATMGCPDDAIRKVDSALRPVRYDTATDRSVLGSMRVAQQDLQALLYRTPDVMALDPMAVARQLNGRPATVYGKWVHPDEAMREAVMG